MKVKYIERQLIDHHKVANVEKTLHAKEKYQIGNRTYFRLNSFDYVAIKTQYILSIE